MKKSIFKATFEESLNLEDDELASLQKEQHEKTKGSFDNGKGKRKFTIKNILLTLLMPIGFNSLLVGLSWLYHTGADELTVKTSAFRLLTWHTHLLLLGIWFLLIIVGKLLQQTFILPYRYQFHWFTYLVMLLVEMDLIGVELASTNIISFTFIVLVFGVILLSSLMLYTAPASIRGILYGESKTENRRNKIAKFLATYGLIVFGLALIVNYILSFFSIGLTDNLTNIGIVVVWLISNIAGLWLGLYIGLPYFLQGYYKWKYPEEYREWEGKSLEEWYGKKYLKKHKELLEKE